MFDNFFILEPSRAGFFAARWHRRSVWWISNPGAKLQAFFVPCLQPSTGTPTDVIGEDVGAVGYNGLRPAPPDHDTTLSGEHAPLATLFVMMVTAGAGWTAQGNRRDFARRDGSWVKRRIWLGRGRLVPRCGRVLYRLSRERAGFGKFRVCKEDFDVIVQGTLIAIERANIIGFSRRDLFSQQWPSGFRWHRSI
jgi:hypothetical protein